jgi:hypothetical protein
MMFYRKKFTAQSQLEKRSSLERKRRVSIIEETTFRTSSGRGQIAVGQVLEMRSVDSLQEMLDTPSV